MDVLKLPTSAEFFSQFTRKEPEDTCCPLPSPSKILPAPATLPAECNFADQAAVPVPPTPLELKAIEPLAAPLFAAKNQIGGALRRIGSGANAGDGARTDSRRHSVWKNPSRHFATRHHALAS